MVVKGKAINSRFPLALKLDSAQPLFFGGQNCAGLPEKKRLVRSEGVVAESDGELPFKDPSNGFGVWGVRLQIYEWRELEQRFHTDYAVTIIFQQRQLFCKRVAIGVFRLML